MSVDYTYVKMCFFIEVLHILQTVVKPLLPPLFYTLYRSLPPPTFSAPLCSPCLTPVQNCADSWTRRQEGVKALYVGLFKIACKMLLM